MGQIRILTIGDVVGQNALDTLEKCMQQGILRMRHFQRQLIADGLKLKAFSLEKIIDIDHASDIQKAEQFISEK